MTTEPPDEIDRFDAEVLADLLKVPVEAIPEDMDDLTAQLWQVIYGDEQMPESVEVRWSFIVEAYFGLGFGMGLL